MTYIFKSITHDSSTAVVSKATDSGNTQTEIPKPRDFSYPLTEIRRILVTAEKERKEKKKSSVDHTLSNFDVCHMHTRSNTFDFVTVTVRKSLFFAYLRVWHRFFIYFFIKTRTEVERTGVTLDVVL